MKKTSLFRILMLLYLVAVCVLCFSNFKSAPKVPWTILGIPTDKVVHFCMFFPFPFLASGCFGYDRLKPGKTVLATCIIFLLGCLVAGATEVIQGTMPCRTMDRYDFLADAVALSVCSLIVFIIDFIKMRRAQA